MSNAKTQWLTIEDFTPGIWSAGRGMTRGSIHSYSWFDEGGLAPIGSARVDETYRCVPGPGGKGLMGGPCRRSTYTMDVGILPSVGSFSELPLVNGYEMIDGGYDYLSLEYVAGANRVWALVGDVLHGTRWLVDSITEVGAISHYTCAGLTQTRMKAAAPFNEPGEPVLNYTFEFGDGTTSRGATVTPNPAALGNTTALVQLSGGVSIGPANLFGHQGRLVALLNVAYTRLTAYGENILFTDPPGVKTFDQVHPALTTDASVFYPENASGYGAWGSLSASSLILVKRNGGGVLVNGDIASPQVSYLPGIQSTGYLVSKAAVTSLGLVYASMNGGLWVWNGGSGSAKLSPQLEPNFWRHGSESKLFDGTSRGGPSFQALQWNEYIICSGNWLYHIPTGGWWRLDDPSSRDHTFYAFNSYPDFGLLVAARTRLSPVSGTFNFAALTGEVNYADTYQDSYPAADYSWRSQPYKVTTDTDIQITDMSIVYQGAVGMVKPSLIKITFYGFDGEQAGDAIIINVPDEKVVRRTLGLDISADYISFKIESIGDQDHVGADFYNDPIPAPMIHSISIGYQDDGPALLAEV